MQLPSVKVKLPYARSIETLPRRASFIATTNMTDILADPSGSRRFIGVELTAPIDVTTHINYDQLYAQAMDAIYKDERYWFDQQETAELIASNMCFGIVVSEWNDEITGALLSGAVKTLELHGALQENIHVKTVPGSFELIYGAQQMCKAAICLNRGLNAIWASRIRAT